MIFIEECHEILMVDPMDFANFGSKGCDLEDQVADCCRVRVTGVHEVFQLGLEDSDLIPDQLFALTVDDVHLVPGFDLLGGQFQKFNHLVVGCDRDRPVTILLKLLSKNRADDGKCEQNDQDFLHVTLLWLGSWMIG